MDAAFAITAAATAFTIIDPVGMVPLTLSVTASAPAGVRKRMIDLAVLVAAGVIVFMALVGGALLRYLGITLSAFSIAGGILLLLISIDMLFGRPSGAKKTAVEEQEAMEHDNVAVFPLAIPMIAGPGTIATVLLLVNLSHGNKIKLLVVFAAYAVALLSTWLCMRGAGLVLKVLGKTGVQVMTRLLGIILSALAVQFVLNGLAKSPLVHELGPTALISDAAYRY